MGWWLGKSSRVVVGRRLLGRERQSGQVGVVWRLVKSAAWLSKVLAVWLHMQCEKWGDQRQMEGTLSKHGAHRRASLDETMYTGSGKRCVWMRW